MIDNSQDKGYITVYLKETGNEWHLCEMNLSKNSDEDPFYVDYENGTIFIVTNNGKSIIGRYEAAPGPYDAVVLDYPSNRVIGHVGSELICFCRKEADSSVGRYSPEEECLAYYTKNGSITSKSIFPYWGIINGSEIGGAAAFVALFYNYNFKSVFRDFFTLDDREFKKKHASYMR